MCKSGNTKKVCYSEEYSRGITVFDVDECIAPIVQALNKAYIKTIGSCCGHGKTTGWIHLEDDTYLIMAPNRAKFITHKYAIWELIKDG